MIKLAANISKKVPLPGVDYSSQSYGASMEVEVSDGDKPEVIKERISELYSLLSQTIDEQIAEGCTKSHAGNGNGNGNGVRPQAAQGAPPRQNGTPVNRIAAQNGQKPAAGTYRNTDGNSATGATAGPKSLTATQAQQRAIFAICKSLGLDLQAVLADYNVTDAAQLHVRTASQLIDELKAKQNSNA